MNAIVVGHSTVLFDAGPFHILTDPNFDSSMGFIIAEQDHNSHYTFTC